jgi:serine/threonine protein kinase
MRCEKTSVAEMDSAEARDPNFVDIREKRRTKWRDRHNGYWQTRRIGEKPPLTLGNIIHFIIAVFFLWPIFLVIAAIWSLGDAVNFVRHTVEACISSTFWFGRLCKEWIGGMYLHKASPAMLRLRGQRRAFGHEAGKDWINAGKSLVGIGRAWSKTFGLGGLFRSLEKRIEHANVDWRRYVATAAYDNSQAPADFPEQYVVVDELPPGGSSARLYIVRKAEDGENGTLYVLKYFNLRAGGNLESVVRESQAAQLAQKLGLIIESKLAEAAFWYVMPYYRGETLTGGVMRNIKQAREAGGLAGHYRVSLGYIHQLLQIIAQYHEAGVFHKDIKPDNLIINGERIYLVDIGLMTPLGSMSQLTTHGTEYFRDPEMVRLALEGREVREVDAAKFDVYSIGAVLFFALSGEFPTSGALSRLPNEVPTATQWVVNRAMTGMHQRYADARAMLTDVDYLCWAASQAQLEQVKPADLPSFKGMPVPIHLQPQVPVHNTEYRERLAASPGGYGAWYSAPLYERPRKGLTIGKAAAILLLVGGLAAIGLVSLGVFAGIAKDQREQVAATQDEPLSGRLPGESAKLKPVFDDIDKSLERGVHTDSVTYYEPTARVDLLPKLVRGVDDITREWETEILRDLRKHKINSPGTVLGPREVVFVSVDNDEADAAKASGIEHEFRQEAARQLLQLAAYDEADLQRVRDTVGGMSDKWALHREISAKFADAGRTPAFIVVFTIEHADAGDQIHLRAIYPGREYRAVVPFSETGKGPAPVRHD